MKQTHTVPKSLGYVCVYFVKVYILCSQITLYIRIDRRTRYPYISGFLFPSLICPFLIWICISACLNYTHKPCWMQPYPSDAIPCVRKTRLVQLLINLFFFRKPISKYTHSATMSTILIFLIVLSKQVILQKPHLQ